MYKIPHSKPFIGAKDYLVVGEQINSGMHTSGEKVKELEEKICKLIKARYSKATNSGTSALHLALLSLDIKKNDEVILPSYVCQAVLNAVNYTQAKPVLADIDSKFKKGYNISTKTIKPLITNKTKAIIVPHMFGHLADIEEIKQLKIPIIEDCAQSLGSSEQKGLISVFSFYATKMISTGNGGMITTNSKKIKQRLDDLTQYDKTDSYNIAYNYNLSDIQASLGISQLNSLDKFIERRKHIADKYNKAFKDLDFVCPNFNQGVPFRYVIRFKNREQRDNLQNKLKKTGIDAEFPIFKPLHQYLNLSKSLFPRTSKTHNKTLSIPIYPALYNKEVDYIIESIRESLT